MGDASRVGSEHAPVGRIVEGAVYDARLEAERLRAGAQAEADALLGAARAEAEALREAARREGLEAGRAEAAAIVARARAEATAIAERRGDDLAAIAVRVAERLLGRELVLAPSAVADVAATVLAESAARGAVILRVHPDDAGALEEARDRLARAARRADAVSLVADERVGRGGCVVETDAGTFDGRLEVQLEAFRRALAETLTS